MNSNNLTKYIFGFSLFQNIGRKGLFRFLNVNPDAIGESDLSDDPGRRLVYEVKTTRGLRIFRR